MDTEEKSVFATSTGNEPVTDLSKNIELFADTYVIALKRIHHQGYVARVEDVLNSLVMYCMFHIRDDGVLPYGRCPRERVIASAYDEIPTFKSRQSRICSSIRSNLTISKIIDIFSQKASIPSAVRLNVIESVKALVDELGTDRVLVTPTSLTIITENIELVDVHEDIEVFLGKFEVEIDLEPVYAKGKGLNVRYSHSYDPGTPMYLVRDMSDGKYATRDEGEVFVHPHVRQGRVCEGVAADPLITLALREGELTVWWDLVSGILRTYNEFDPYLSLRDWNKPIYACKCCQHTSYDNAYYYTCDKCGDDVCDDCSWHSDDGLVCDECDENPGK